MSWNDSNVARLKELWDQGLPTAQIGKLLGFTKNAVVGKAHRIGLERRPSPIRRTAVKPDRKKARSPIVPTLKFESLKEEPKKHLNNKFFNLLLKTFLQTKLKEGVNGQKVTLMSLTLNFVAKIGLKKNHIV